MTVAHGLEGSLDVGDDVGDADVPDHTWVDVFGQPSDEALGRFRMALGRLSRRLRLEGATEEINLIQHNALAMIWRIGPMTPGELASAERVKPPSMTRAVNALVEAGLVDKLPHPSDGRQVVVSLTDRGHDALMRARDLRTAWLRDHFDTLSSAEQATLLAATPLLERLADS